MLLVYTGQNAFDLHWTEWLKLSAFGLLKTRWLKLSAFDIYWTKWLKLNAFDFCQTKWCAKFQLVFHFSSIKIYWRTGTKSEWKWMTAPQNRAFSWSVMAVMWRCCTAFWTQYIYRKRLRYKMTVLYLYSALITISGSINLKSHLGPGILAKLSPNPYVLSWHIPREWDL